MDSTVGRMPCIQASWTSTLKSVSHTALLKDVKMTTMALGKCAIDGASSDRISMTASEGWPTIAPTPTAQPGPADPRGDKGQRRRPVSHRTSSRASGASRWRGRCRATPQAVRRLAESHTLNHARIPWDRCGSSRRAGPLGPALLHFRWWRGQDLNLRPSGYEPDELPDCSTPRRLMKSTRSRDCLSRRRSSRRSCVRAIRPTLAI